MNYAKILRDNADNFELLRHLVQEVNGWDIDQFVNDDEKEQA